MLFDSTFPGKKERNFVPKISHLKAYTFVKYFISTLLVVCSFHASVGNVESFRFEYKNRESENLNYAAEFVKKKCEHFVIGYLWRKL